MKILLPLVTLLIHLRILKTLWPYLSLNGILSNEQNPKEHH